MGLVSPSRSDAPGSLPAQVRAVGVRLEEDEDGANGQNTGFLHGSDWYLNRKHYHGGLSLLEKTLRPAG